MSIYDVSTALDAAHETLNHVVPEIYQSTAASRTLTENTDDRIRRLLGRTVASVTIEKTDPEIRLRVVLYGPPDGIDDLKVGQVLLRHAFDGSVLRVVSEDVGDHTILNLVSKKHPDISEVGLLLKWLRDQLGHLNTDQQMDANYGQSESRRLSKITRLRDIQKGLARAIGMLTELSLYTNEGGTDRFKDVQTAFEKSLVFAGHRVLKVGPVQAFSNSAYGITLKLKGDVRDKTIKNLNRGWYPDGLKYFRVYSASLAPDGDATLLTLSCDRHVLDQAFPEDERSKLETPLYGTLPKFEDRVHQEIVALRDLVAKVSAEDPAIPDDVTSPAAAQAEVTFPTERSASTEELDKTRAVLDRKIPSGPLATTDNPTPAAEDIARGYEHSSVIEGVVLGADNEILGKIPAEARKHWNAKPMFDALGEGNAGLELNDQEEQTFSEIPLTVLNDAVAEDIRKLKETVSEHLRQELQKKVGRQMDTKQTSTLETTKDNLQDAVEIAGAGILLDKLTTVLQRRLADHGIDSTFLSTPIGRTLLQLALPTVVLGLLDIKAVQDGLPEAARETIRDLVSTAQLAAGVQGAQTLIGFVMPMLTEFAEVRGSLPASTAQSLDSVLQAVSVGGTPARDI